VLLLIITVDSKYLYYMGMRIRNRPCTGDLTYTQPV